MRQSSCKIRGLGLLGMALLMTFTGCATVDKYVAEINKKLPSWSKRSKNKNYSHKVRYAGETLSIISEWYTGDAGNWRALAKVNPRLDPDHIRIGTMIQVPENLLHTRKSMPKAFVKTATKRRKTSPKPAGYYHKVMYSGETLSLIAKWYTGEFENWRALTKVNPKLDPDRIIVGDKILIPHKLLHTHKPMPRSFVIGSAETKKPKSAPSKVETAVTKEKRSEPPPDDIEVLELFGPK